MIHSIVDGARFDPSSYLTFELHRYQGRIPGAAEYLSMQLTEQSAKAAARKRPAFLFAWALLILGAVIVFLGIMGLFGLNTQTPAERGTTLIGFAVFAAVGLIFAGVGLLLRRRAYLEPRKS